MNDGKNTRIWFDDRQRQAIRRLNPECQTPVARHQCITLAGEMGTLTWR